MHAIRQHEFGSPEALRYEQVPDPVPPDGYVRIVVEAAGVHLLDTSIRQGTSGGPFPLPDLPMTPGREVAGVVDAIGPNVDADWRGRRVVAHLGQASGGYAELAVASVASLHTLIDDMAADAAVAMIGTGRTTMAILELAEITADDVVLVPAAAGGIGALLVQAAVNAAATVIGAAGGADKVKVVEQLGATYAVDYDDPSWTAIVRDTLGPRGVTLALDGVGGRRGRDALELLGAGGRLVLFGWSSGEPTELSAADLVARSLTATAAIGPRIMKRPGGIRELEDRSLAALAAGRLVPLVGQHFALADAAEAHRAMEGRATVGKTVLVP
jgi:NADPH2:quinone reductase